MKDLDQILNQLKNQLNLNQIQLGPLTTPITINFYEKWIAQNFQAEMGYLKTHLEVKKYPQLLNGNLKSVLSISQSYFPLPEPATQKLPARTALYAQNKDYHFWLKEKLLTVIKELKKVYPEDEFLPYVDSGPILERNWAFETGLGWFGKNTCLIHPQFGSLFFIAEILTTLSAPENFKIEPLPDFCGKCTKCLDICPTKALVSPQVLKAELCISYLTIESKSNPPIHLRPLMTDWFFGCDLCQTVCPWNEKVFRTQKIPEQQALSTTAFLNLDQDQKMELISFFKFILLTSNKKLAKHFEGSALLRSGGNGLKRNALIVIGNRKLVELKNEVQTLSDHAHFMELAQWSLAQLQ